MTENETSSFRLGSGTIEETAEVKVSDDGLHQIPIRKLARRSRITSFLLLVLMILMFAWGYWDLQGRFDRQANTGNREIKNISAVFEDRLNELDSRFAAIEKKSQADFAKLDKLTVKLQKNIGELQKSMAAIVLSGTMRKEKKAMLDQMQKAFAPIKADIDSLSKDLGTFDQRVRTQLAPLAKQLGQTRDELSALQQTIKAAAGESIDRDEMALEMLKVKKTYQQQIASEAALIRKQVSLLDERMERLESKLRALNTRAPAPSGKNTTSAGRDIQEQNLP